MAAVGSCWSATAWSPVPWAAGTWAGGSVVPVTPPASVLVSGSLRLMDLTPSVKLISLNG